MKQANSSQSIYHRIQGLFFGLALGDALGAPVKFLSLGEIRDQYPEMGIQTPPPVAKITEATQLTWVLTNALLSSTSTTDTDLLVEDVARNLVNEPRFETSRFLDKATRDAIQKLNQGQSWQQLDILDSKESGALIRIAPIGALYMQDADRLREVATATSRITHRHPSAVASAVGGAYLIKLALMDVPINLYLSSLIQFTEGMSDELHYALLRTGHVLGWGSAERSIKHLGEGWIAEEALALALYCVLKHPNDYAAAVRLAVNIDGDSHTIASITGGIMGAKLGIRAIPKRWISALQSQNELNQVADKVTQVLLA